MFVINASLSHVEVPHSNTSKTVVKCSFFQAYNMTRNNESHRVVQFFRTSNRQTNSLEQELGWN